MKNAVLLAATGLFIATPATAEIKSQSDSGFVTGHSAEVLAKPDEVWKRLIAPKDWWNPAHSWSGKTDGFYIDPQAGGCFCELIQEKGADSKTNVTGSVEHMRVLFADKGKVLRMQGALGPLQSEAVLGTLTVAMEPLKDGAGTRLSFAYVVGGYMRYKVSEIGPAVDKVLAEQFASLIKPLGKIIPGEPKAEAKEGEEWSLDPDALEEKAPEEKAPEARASVEKAKEPAPKVAPKPAAKPAAEKPKAATTDKPKPATSTDE
jgi:hypothetical protein